MEAAQQAPSWRDVGLWEGRLPSSEEEARRGVHAGRLLEGRFYLERRIGEDALGLVYAAVDRQHHQRVWVRLLPIQVSTTQEVYERAWREIRIQMSLQHPHLLGILHVGEEDGFGLYVVSEACLGHPLRRILEVWGSLSREQMGRAWASYCDALHYAHRKGLLHGTLSPSHLWWAGGSAWSEIRVGWFGMPRLVHAPVADGLATVSPPYSLRYRAPEQIVGVEKIDQACDIYTSGLLLFEMLTGYHPLVWSEGGEGEEVKQRVRDWRALHLTYKAPRLSQVRPDMVFPEALEMLLASMLEKEVILRPASMQEVLQRWQEAIAQWTPPERLEIPQEIPRELMGVRSLPSLRSTFWHEPNLRPLWQEAVPFVPLSLREVVEGSLREEQRPSKGAAPLAASTSPSPALRGEGAWLDLLAFSLQRGASSSLARQLFVQLPLEGALVEAALLSEAPLSSPHQTSSVLSVQPPRATTQEVALLKSTKQTQSNLQTLAAQEILSMSELEARLPELARLNSAKEGEGAGKLRPPQLRDAAWLKAQEQGRLGEEAAIEQGGVIAAGAPWSDGREKRLSIARLLMVVAALLLLLGAVVWWMGRAANPMLSTPKPSPREKAGDAAKKTAKPRQEPPPQDRKGSLPSEGGTPAKPPEQLQPSERPKESLPEEPRPRLRKREGRRSKKRRGRTRPKKRPLRKRPKRPKKRKKEAHRLLQPLRVVVANAFVLSDVSLHEPRRALSLFTRSQGSEGMDV